MATDISEFDGTDVEPQIDHTETSYETTGDSGYDTSSVEPVSYDEADVGYSLADQVRELGFADVQDDSDAQMRLLDSYQQLQAQNNQFSQYYTDTAQNLQYYQNQADQYQQLQGSEQWRQYQEWQQQQPQQEAQAESAEPQHWWSPPEYDVDAANRYRIQQVNPETGQIETVWAPNTPQEVIDSSTQYAEYLENWADGIVRRPHEVFPQMIEHEFDKLFASRFSAIMEYNNNNYVQQQQEQLVSDINQRNADWVYQVDPVTNQYLQDADGNLVMSPQGQAVTQYVNYFRQLGIEDPQTLWNLATRMYAGDISSARLESASQQVPQQQPLNTAPPTPAPAPAPVQAPAPAPQPAAFAEHIPAAGGSFGLAEDPYSRSQNPHLTAGDKLRQQGLADGLF